MKKLTCLVAIMLVASLGTLAMAQSKKQTKMDGYAEQTLESLFKASPNAAGKFEKAYGYAVFKGIEIKAFGGDRGHGHGVAVDKASDGRWYMYAVKDQPMDAPEAGVVLLFAKKDDFMRFVKDGWIAGAKEKNAEESLKAAGMEIYVMTEDGLHKGGSLAGIRIWN